MQSSLILFDKINDKGHIRRVHRASPTSTPVTFMDLLLCLICHFTSYFISTARHSPLAPPRVSVGNGVICVRAQVIAKRAGQTCRVT